jgi:hypothetical protein
MGAARSSGRCSKASLDVWPPPYVISSARRREFGTPRPAVGCSPKGMFGGWCLSQSSKLSMERR